MAWGQIPQANNGAAVYKSRISGKNTKPVIILKIKITASTFQIFLTVLLDIILCYYYLNAQKNYSI